MNRLKPAGSKGIYQAIVMSLAILVSPFIQLFNELLDKRRVYTDPLRPEVMQSMMAGTDITVASADQCVCYPSC